MTAKKNRMFKLAGVVLTCAVIAACSSSDPANKTVGNSGEQSSGNADFTTFVAIGDSITAGYADGALYLLGQQNSFPLMLAQQFAAADGVAVNFTQPLVSDNLGGLLFGGNPNPDFDNRFALNTKTEKPERVSGTPTTEVIGSGLNNTTFNNMGVPGAKSFHLLAPGYGNPAGLGAVPPTANPYFVRFTSDIASNLVTVIGDAAAQQPSFFTFWIGNNDVLGYATSGGDDSDPITPTANFDDAYHAALDAVNTSTNKGVLVNIPDVSALPYFTTVPYNAIPMTEDQAAATNAAFIAYNEGLLAAQGADMIDAAEVTQRTIAFSAGQNAVVILDEDLTDISGLNAALVNMRQATENDLIVLPAASIIGTLADPDNPASVIGVGVPLADKDVLIPSEIEAIDTARTAFNDTIKAAADDDNLAFLDAAAIMTELSTTGVDYGTGTINSEFVRGGAFSLDGVHPTARGYAVIANSIIDVINSSFDANVYRVDPSTYPAVLLK